MRAKLPWGDAGPHLAFLPAAGGPIPAVNSAATINLSAEVSLGIGMVLKHQGFSGNALRTLD